MSRETIGRLSAFSGALLEIELDSEAATRAGGLRRDPGLGLADAVIAATALQAGRIVLTRNTRYFAHVPELEIRSPEDLETG